MWVSVQILDIELGIFKDETDGELIEIKNTMWVRIHRWFDGLIYSSISEGAHESRSLATRR